MEQRSDEWATARIGLITSTRAHQLLSSAATRRTLMVDLIREYAAPKVKSFEGTKSTKRGIALEDEAISAYCLLNNSTATHEGLIYSDVHPLLATSPDALINDDGGIEVKCYEADAHIKAVLGHTEAKEINQCKWHSFVTGRAWWDLFYYSDEFEGKLGYRILRITLDDSEREAIKTKSHEFIGELQNKMKELDLTFDP